MIILLHSYIWPHFLHHANILRCVSSSYRFMDMFPDTAFVREIQRELDTTIQEGVRNITRLIRATNPAITGPLQIQKNTGQTDTTSSNSSGGRRNPSTPRRSGQALGSSLANRLVRDGLLTTEMLQQLQKEWSKGQRKESTNQSSLDAKNYSNGNQDNKRKKRK